MLAEKEQGKLTESLWDNEELLFGDMENKTSIPLEAEDVLNLC